MADKFQIYDDATGSPKAVTPAQAGAVLTGAVIKSEYEGEADTNAFTDAEQSKLGGIESGATADQTGAEIKSAYEGEADTNAFTDALLGKLSDVVFPWAAKVTGLGPFVMAEGTINRYDDSGAAGMTVHLPVASSDQVEVEIKEVGGSANSVTVTTAAGTTSIEKILDASTVTSDAVAVAGAGVRYKWDATDSIWRIVRKVFV